MKTLTTVLILLAAAAAGDTIDELAHIKVQEWGVITWSGDDAIVTSSPEEALLIPFIPEQDDQGYAVRAPVIYFNGPEFSGTVTVRTDNGTIFDIYPDVPNCDRSHNSVQWTASFIREAVREFPLGRGIAPGEWNYGMWRVDPALTVDIDGIWQDKFLYYETAPETLDFLPYRAGMESIPEEYSDIRALVFKNGTDGMTYCACTLGDVVYGGSMSYLAIDEDPLMIQVMSWADDILEPEQTEAMWRTWSSWFMNDHIHQEVYGNGMVLYMIPERLTERISTIEVQPIEADFPVDINRCILAAIPL